MRIEKEMWMTKIIRVTEAGFLFIVLLCLNLDFKINGSLISIFGEQNTCTKFLR